VALEYVRQLALIHRSESAACALLLFDQPACLGRSIEKQHTSGFRAGALPGMRHAAWHEGAGAGAADRDRVADLEGDLAAQDIGHLVTVVMQVTIGAGALSPVLYGLFSDAIGLTPALVLVAAVVLLTVPLAWKLTRVLNAVASGLRSPTSREVP
jgi:hypothetical protein